MRHLSRMTVIPEQYFKEFPMLTKYIDAAMRRATFKPLPNETYFGRVPGLQGVWAEAPTIEQCRGELQEVLEEWIVFGLQEHHPFPSVDGIELVAEKGAWY